MEPVSTRVRLSIGSTGRDAFALAMPQSKIQSNMQSTTHDYIFTPTQDWFSGHIETWVSLIPLVHTPAPRVLEIGSWEGRSTVFLLENLCKDGGDITCVDHFDLMTTAPGRERYAKISHNLSLTGKQYRIIDQFSVPALMILLQEEMGAPMPGFDWIYVDGSHEADDTFLDGELAWRLAKENSIFIFDDYHWDVEPESSSHHPRRGIDAFLNLHDGEYERLSDASHGQVILRKKSVMRIGFLVKQPKHEAVRDAFGYGINIVLVFDSHYAMAAAVALRSAVTKTRGRITVYIIDCGLGKEEKDKIQASVPKTGSTSIMFITPPKDSLFVDTGAAWAKVDMIHLLPVEKVLYLDSDVLVRGDLNELWNTDLSGRAIGAVPDVGYPMGHKGEKIAYFNSGVLLMDLSVMRKISPSDIRSSAEQMKDEKFKDQDLLNALFAGQWLPLTLNWNAQGLGTYAKIPSVDRESLQLEEMGNADIVHFTGPVDPSLADILNPWVQPYTAKPWGFAGAPGHPYANEWWSVHEETAWKGWRLSEEYQRMIEVKKERAIQAATEEFRRRMR